MTARPGLDTRLLLGGDPALRPPYRRLLSEAWSLAAARPAPPDPATLPHGGGQRVLVIPAFLAWDGLMADLRRFLRRCGFQAEGWGLGMNWGPTPRILGGLLRRLDALAGDGPVGLLGVSMGGVLARDLAHERPAAVSRVVTVASPFRLPVPTTIGPLVRLCAPYYSGEADLARLQRPLPMPSTAIYTRDDGIVAPSHCWASHPGGTVVEAAGPHLTICRNPAVLRAIVHGLAGTGRGDAENIARV